MIRLISISGLLVLVSWSMGWDQAALALYLGTALFWLATESVKILGLARRLDFSGSFDDILVSTNLHASKTGRIDALMGSLMVIGQIAAWPFRSLLGALIGAFIGATYLYKRPHSELDVQSVIEYCAPGALQVLMAISCQSIFMLVGFSAETQSSLLFQICVGFQVICFVLFLFHFHLRPKFEKNFSASALKPLLFFWVGMVGVLVSAAVTRQVFGVAFGIETTEISGAKIYAMLSAIIQNSGLVDVLDVVRESQDLPEFVAKLREFGSSIDIARALDIFLGLSFLSTFGRSIWSIFRFQRDDEDHLARVLAQIRMGQSDRARTELDGFESDEVRALPAIYLEIEADNITAMHHEIAYLPKSDLMRAFGDDPLVTHYLALQGYFGDLSHTADQIVRAITTFAHANNRRGVQAAVLVTAFSRSSKAFKQVVEAGNQNNPIESLAALIRLVDVAEDPGADINAAVAKEFPLDTNIARVTLTVLLIGMANKRHDQAVTLRPAIDQLVQASLDHARAPEKLSDIFLAVSIQGIFAAHGYKSAYGTRSETIEKFNDACKDIMKSRGIRLPADIRRLLSVPVRF